MPARCPKSERDTVTLKPLKQLDVWPKGVTATREEMPFDCVDTTVFVESHGDVAVGLDCCARLALLVSHLSSGQCGQLFPYP